MNCLLPQTGLSPVLVCYESASEAEAPSSPLIPDVYKAACHEHKHIWWSLLDQTNIDLSWLIVADRPLPHLNFLILLFLKSSKSMAFLKSCGREHAFAMYYMKGFTLLHCPSFSLSSPEFWYCAGRKKMPFSLYLLISLCHMPIIAYYFCMYFAFLHNCIFSKVNNHKHLTFSDREDAPAPCSFGCFFLHLLYTLWKGGWFFLENGTPKGVCCSSCLISEGILRNRRGASFQVDALCSGSTDSVPFLACAPSAGTGDQPQVWLLVICLCL